MPIYDGSAQTRLREKLDYELWLLEFLSQSQERLAGGWSLSTITLTNREPGANQAITVTDFAGTGEAMKIMDAVSPLTFTASYKILDMIFEWILEENRNDGRIAQAPWRFSEKIETVRKGKNQLVSPPLFHSQRYVEEYLLAFYANLLKFRNEIVHNHRFSVSGGKLRIDAFEDGQSYTVELDPEELGAFVRIAVASANMLLGDLSLGLREDSLFKWNLDRIEKLHRLARFGQRKPLLVDVILKVDEQRGLFAADLKFVRETLGRIYPDADVQFNLKIVGLVKDQPSIGWFFPVNSVPRDDVIELGPDAYEEYRTAL